MLVVWIHASSPTRFQQGYRDIADRLLLPGREDPKADVLQLVHAWLSDGRNGRWLMILDNVDDDSVFFSDDQGGKPLGSFLPQTANGTILITSRNTVAATNLVGGHGGVVEVEPMGEEDALALLHTRVPFGEATRADAKALVHALERIPLAITHAAAYIKTRASTTTISTYLKLFHKSEANQVHLLSRKEWKDIRRDHSIRHAVIATWQISFQHMQATEPQAADLLALMSMFDKQGIPRWLLQGTTSQLDFDDALAPLLSFSLVKTEVGEQALAMHRLVQLSMRRWLEAESELGRWVKESIEALSAAFPSRDYGTWEQCKVLLPHVKEIVAHRTEDREGEEKQAESASRAGWYLLLHGEYTAAEGLIRLSLEIREKVLGVEHPHTLTSVSNLGSVLERQGKYDEAEAMHRRDLEGSEDALGPKHTSTLNTVNNLGLVYRKQGKLGEAEQMYIRALQGYEDALGPKHTLTLDTIDNLDSLYKEMNIQVARQVVVVGSRGHSPALKAASIEEYSQAIDESQGAEDNYPRSEETNHDSRTRYPPTTVDITATASSAVSRDIWSSSHGQNTIDISTIPTSVDPGGDQEGKGDRSSTDNTSIYTSDIPESLAYAQELATNFFKISEPLPDVKYLKRIHEVLPDLLRGFALRIGAESQSPEHFKMMKFIHGIRG